MIGAGDNPLPQPEPLALRRYKRRFRSNYRLSARFLSDPGIFRAETRSARRKSPNPPKEPKPAGEARVPKKPGIQRQKDHLVAKSVLRQQFLQPSAPSATRSQVTGHRSQVTGHRSCRLLRPESATEFHT